VDNNFFQVEKNSNDPFLISGCKVADGNGTMLVNFGLWFPFLFFAIVLS